MYVRKVFIKSWNWLIFMGLPWAYFSRCFKVFLKGIRIFRRIFIPVHEITSCYLTEHLLRGFLLICFLSWIFFVRVLSKCHDFRWQGWIIIEFEFKITLELQSLLLINLFFKIVRDKLLFVRLLRKKTFSYTLKP